MAIDPVVIAFAVRGMQDVSRAFETVAERAARFERQTQQGAERAGKARVKGSQGEAKERERAYAKLFDSIERDEKRAQKAAEQAAKAKERSEEKAGAFAARESKKAADAEIAQAKRVVAEKERLYRQLERSLARSAVQQVAAEERASAQAMRGRRAVGRRIGGIVTGSVGGLVSGAASVAGLMVGMGGGAMLVDAGRRQLGAENAAALLANSATIGGVAPKGASVANILGAASQASRETGVDKGELIGAVQNYVAKSSDFSDGMENMRFFARLSKASGTKLDDITGAAGILRAQNKDLSAGDMRQMLLDLTEQGKQGAVEISDLAHLAGGLGSTRGLYAGSQTDNQRKLLALAQITRTESESPEEAATGVKDLGIEALKKANGKHAPAWLKAVTKGGIISSPEALIDAALTGTKGNLGELEGVFGARGSKAFMRLAPIFNAAGGGAKGLAAVHGELDPILNAKGSDAQLDQQLATVMSTPAARFESAINRIRDTLEEKLEPHLERFADKLPELLPKLEAIIDEAGKLADWFADNPFMGIGAVVLAAVSKDLAAAGIGAGVKAILEKLLSGGGVPIPGGGGGAGNILPVVGAGILAASVTASIIDTDIASREGAQRQSASGTTGALVDAYGLSRKAKTGTVTAKDIAGAQASIQQLTVETEAKRQAINTNDMGVMQTAVMQLVDPSGAKQHSQDVYNEQLRSYQQSKQALDAMVKAANDAAIAMKSMASNTDPNNPARRQPIAGGQGPR